MDTLIEWEIESKPGTSVAGGANSGIGGAASSIGGGTLGAAGGSSGVCCGSVRLGAAFDSPVENVQIVNRIFNKLAAGKHNTSIRILNICLSVSHMPPFSDCTAPGINDRNRNESWLY